MKNNFKKDLYMQKTDKKFQEAITNYIKKASWSTDKIYVGNKITQELLSNHHCEDLQDGEVPLVVINTNCFNDSFTGLVITNRNVYFELATDNWFKWVSGKKELANIKYFQIVKSFDKNASEDPIYDFIINDKKMGYIEIKGGYDTELDFLKFINGLTIFLIKQNLFSEKLSNKYIKIGTAQIIEKEKLLKKIIHKNVFDKYGDVAKSKYNLTIGSPYIFAIFELIGLIGLMFFSFEFIQKYITIFTIFFALYVIIDYICVKKLMGKQAGILTYYLIFSCLFLLIPIVGFIPARHFWVYNREKELMQEYNKYRLNHPEEKQQSVITTPAWKTSLLFGESLALIKLLEFLAYV